MNFMRSLRGLVRLSSCRASRAARDDDHDPAPPVLWLAGPARRPPPPGPGTRRPVAAPRVARQDLGARLGPLGLVQLVSVVRVHDRRPFVYFALSSRRRIPPLATDTNRSEISLLIAESGDAAKRIGTGRDGQGRTSSRSSPQPHSLHLARNSNHD